MTNLRSYILYALHIQKLVCFWLRYFIYFWPKAMVIKMKILKCWNILMYA